MNASANKIGNAFKADLAAIRSAVGQLPAARWPWDSVDTIDFVAQGNRLVNYFENWLLDDEQMQILSMQPQHLLILYAAAYLMDIGLTDGAQQPTASHSESHYARSAQFFPVTTD